MDSLKILLNKTKDSSKVNVLNELTRAIANTDIEKAIQYALQAERESQKISFPKGEAQALTALGALSLRKGDIKKAFQYQNNALEIRERIGDVQGEATSLNNLGSLYVEQGNYPSATEYFFKSLKIREAIKDKLGILTCLNNIGLVYNLQAKESHENSIIYEKSLGYFKEALTLAKSLKHSEYESTILYNIAEIHLRRSLSISYTIDEHQRTNRRLLSPAIFLLQHW